MWLDCGRHGTAKIKRLTPYSAVLCQALDVPACEANLIVRVDGKRMKQKVVVTNLSKNGLVAKITPTDDLLPI